jgi:hypothetical protein
VRGGAGARPTPPAGDCEMRVTGLDLGARVLAFVWKIDSSDVDFGIGPLWQVRLHRFADGRDRVVGDGDVSGTCGSVEPKSPNATGSEVVYLQELNNCDATNGGTHSFFVRASGGSRPEERLEPFPVRFPVGEAYALAYDAGTAYWLFGPNEDDPTTGDDPCAGGGCPIVSSPLLPFTPTPDPDPLLEGEN